MDFIDGLFYIFINQQSSINTHKLKILFIYIKKNLIHRSQKAQFFVHYPLTVTGYVMLVRKWDISNLLWVLRLLWNL